MTDHSCKVLSIRDERLNARKKKKIFEMATDTLKKLDTILKAQDARDERIKFVSSHETKCDRNNDNQLRVLKKIYLTERACLPSRKTSSLIINLDLDNKKEFRNLFSHGRANANLLRLKNRIIELKRDDKVIEAVFAKILGRVTEKIAFLLEELIRVSEISLNVKAKNENLNERADKLTDQLDQMSVVTEMKDKQIAEISYELECTRQQMYKFFEDKEREKMVMLQSHIEENTKRDDEIVKLREKIHNLMTKIRQEDEIKREVENIKEDEKKKDSTILELLEQINNTKKQLQEISKIKDDEKKTALLQRIQDIKNLQEDERKRTHDIVKLTQENEILKEKLQLTEDENIRNKNALEEETLRSDQLSVEMKLLRINLTEVSEELNNSKSEIISQANLISDLKEQLEIRDNEIKVLKEERILDMENEIVALKLELTKVRNEKVAINSQLMNNNEKFKEIESKKYELKSKLHCLQMSNYKFEKEISMMNDSYKKLKNFNAELATKILHLFNQISKCSSSTEKLNRYRNMLKKILEEYVQTKHLLHLKHKKLMRNSFQSKHCKF